MHCNVILNRYEIYSIMIFDILMFINVQHLSKIMISPNEDIFYIDHVQLSLEVQS